MFYLFTTLKIEMNSCECPNSRPVTHFFLFSIYQTILGPWDKWPSNPVYHIEDCWISDHTLMPYLAFVVFWNDQHWLRIPDSFVPLCFLTRFQSKGYLLFRYVSWSNDDELLEILFQASESVMWNPTIFNITHWVAG